MSVIQQWVHALTLQQQTVLLTAIRGPDTLAKLHPGKILIMHYRASILRDAKRGVIMSPGDGTRDPHNNLNSFMTNACLEDVDTWGEIIDRYLDNIDRLPHHYHMHLMHAAQIIGYKHPVNLFRVRWSRVYARFVEDAHLMPESEVAMDARLNDWDRRHWVGDDQEYNPRI